MLLGKRRRRRLHGRVRLRDRRVPGESRDDADKVCVALEAGTVCPGEPRVIRQRQPELDVLFVQTGDVATKLLRPYTDDHELGPVDGDRTPDDVRIAAETNLPG